MVGTKSWFLTGDTNDPDSIETAAQIGWFQVLKGYIPYDWTSRQETYYRRQRKKYHTGERWTKELIEFFWTHSRTLWNDRCKFHMHPEKIAQTTPALAPDRRHYYVWKRPMHTPRSCSLTTGVSSTSH
jgi:hypothetical protein